MKYDYTDPFSVCFNIMKMRYNEFDRSFDELELICPGDSVNVFINLETILNHISTIQELDRRLVANGEYPVIIASNILNLAAHYKRFFRDNQLPTKVFLYMTDLDSRNFKESKLNEDYRSYYMNKYTENPKYCRLTEALKETILPEVKKICEFIPDVHLILAKDIDASVVPLLISKQYPEAKNVIITGDVYETQYVFWKEFAVHFMRKSPLYSSTSWTLEGYIKEITKKQSNDETETPILRNFSLYLSLLSVIGDKVRAIDPIRGIGPMTVFKAIRNGVENHLFDYETESIEMIKEAFSEDIQEELVNNFYQFSVKWKESNMSEKDKFDITNQIIDRFDNNSLLKLNATRFYNHQLMLTELTM